MKVSIVTACYNSSKTVLDCITSVNEQTYGDIEHIIIDGASADNTLERIKSVPSRVTRISSEPDKGIYDAMNKGILLASGEVIGILNSDDLYYDNTVIEKVMQLFLSDVELDIVYGDLVYVKQHNVGYIVRLWKSNNYHPRFFELGEVPPHPSVFVKADVYKKAGVFNLDFRLAADYEFLLRIFKQYNFKSRYYPSVLVKMRYGGATNNSLKNILKQNKEILAAWAVNGLKLPPGFLLRKVVRRLIQFIRK